MLLMDSNKLNDQVISLDKILSKKVIELTFKEIISLIFHTVKILSTDTNSEQKWWEKIYREFETEIKRQNNHKWPKVNIVKNDTNQRIDLLSISKLYIRSNNFLTHLFRLLVIENYKRTYNYTSYGYHKILNYKLKNNNNTIVKNLSLYQIFSLFKTFMLYYINIYEPVSDEETCKKSFEYLLAQTIINKL